MRLLFLFALLIVSTDTLAETPRVRIPGGRFAPMYGGVKGGTVVVLPFSLDARPVTNYDYEAFTRASPRWQKGHPSPMVADVRYLAHWNCGDYSHCSPHSRDKNRPVVNISWFAAASYCAWRAGRLPSILEWEFAAAASETKADASRDPDFVQRILTWYGKPAQTLAEVAQGPKNYWGIYDLHGLVWEWTMDFNSVFVSGDNRNDSVKSKNFFCGAGSLDANDRADYAAYMRYAMRNSLQGNYTTNNVGFRCAYE